MACTSNQVSLKLLVNKEKTKVYFAEAGKDFVDVLFSFLTFPLGTIARLVSKESNMPPVSVGSLSSLYGSVSKLDQHSFCSQTCKELLLWPKNSSEDYCSSLKLHIDDSPVTKTKYFLCQDLDLCNRNLLSNSIIKCDCGKTLNKEVPFKEEGVFKFEGLVKDGATFIITDDLNVIPNSTITTFGLLQSCGASMSSVQQVTVNVTHKKVLDLLKCSLLSKSALTDFFLEKKPFPVSPVFCPFNVETKSTIKIDVKIMIRKSDGKILYAQGEDDFANFLFSFLILPLGSVMRLLKGHSSVGCIDRLYKSIVDLNHSKYCIDSDVKNKHADPCLALQFKSIKNRFDISAPYTFRSLYYCYYNRDLGLRFIKGPAVYIATDDLAVSPMSPILGIFLLNIRNVPLDDLMEKSITIGLKEGLSILKASLTSTSALTNGLSHFISRVKEEIKL